MKPSPLQQALAGLAVVLVIAATLLGGLILALGDSARRGIEGVAESSLTATSSRMPSLPALTSTAVVQTPISTGTSSRPAATVIVLPTRTPVTPRETVVVIPSSTRAASATAISASPTARRATASATTPPAAGSCQPPSGWVTYTVKRGDTLYAIGLRYNVTVDRMVEANCLSDTSLEVGNTLYVPATAPHSATPRDPDPVAPAATATLLINPTVISSPGPTGTQTATDGACANPDSIIMSPRVGSVLSGVAQFRGTARLPNFSFYKLEVRREGASTSSSYVTFFTGTAQITNGILGQLNTASFTDGEYWIRLVVVDITGNYPERCAILYPFNN